MKPLTWSEFSRIFLAALIAAVLLNVARNNYSQASAKWLSAPVMLDPTTQISP